MERMQPLRYLVPGRPHRIATTRRPQAMTATPVDDRWDRGSPYERYIGRWSRRIAPLFLDWLAAPPGVRWLDVGCGTGALCALISEHCCPGVTLRRRAVGQVPRLAARNLGSRAQLLTGDACNLPLPGAGCDLVVSALVLNFVPDLPVRARRDAARQPARRDDRRLRLGLRRRDGVIRLFWEGAAALSTPPPRPWTKAPRSSAPRPRSARPSRTPGSPKSKRPRRPGRDVRRLQRTTGPPSWAGRVRRRPTSQHSSRRRDALAESLRTSLPVERTAASPCALARAGDPRQDLRPSSAGRFSTSRRR
ncbi:MAG: class I SAM-dependent methyltransferase [Thermoanaerobaculia bacterium]